MSLETLKRGKVGSKSINKAIESMAAYGEEDHLPTGTPVNAVAATGTLVIAEPVTADDTMTVGTTVYTFKAGATAAAGQIGLGANEAATKLAIVAAINGAHALVSAAAFDGDNCVLTAKTKGTAGNSIAVAETFTHASNVFNTGITHLIGGVNGAVGGAGETKYDSSYLYVCIADNAVSGTNWRRISLGSAY